MTRRGFTVMEISIALGMLVLLASSIFTMLGDLSRARQRLADEIARQDVATVVFERVEAALATVVAGGRETGIRGSHDGLRLLTRGVTPPMAGDVAGVELGDLQGLAISFDREEGVVEAARWDALGDRDGEREPLGDGVERLRLRYLVGTRWQSSFDSGATGGLPAAIEIAIWFGEADAPEAVEDGASERDESDPLALPGMGDEEGEFGGVSPDERAVEVPVRAPDRRRLIVIPDGPEEDDESFASAMAGGGP